jgi:hypothetical protein
MMPTGDTDLEESFPDESYDVFVQYPAHTPLPLFTLGYRIEMEGKTIAIGVTSESKD